MRLHCRKKTSVARINHRGRSVIRPNHIEPTDLTLSNVLFVWLEDLVGHAHIHTKRQERTRIVSIVDKVPAVMEHVLGTPLVGKVFDEVVNKSERWILWQHGSTRVHRLESTNNGGRVTFGRDTSITLKKESRHEDGARLLHAHGVAHRIGLPPVHTVGNSTISK